MKIRILLCGLMCITICSLIGCDTGTQDDPQPTIDPVEQLTEEGAVGFLLQGLVDPVKGYNSLKPSGYSDALYLDGATLMGNNYTFQSTSESRLDKMNQPAFDGSWNASAAVEESKAYWVRYKSSNAYNYLKLRFISINGNEVYLEYKTTAITSELPVEKNVNANEPVEGKLWVTDLSIPHLNTDNYYVEHTVNYSDKQVFNYALEWDNSMKHAAWVAFCFDSTTRGGSYKGSEIFTKDPSLSSEMQTDDTYHKNDGFDKGHLVASADRKFSKIANDQTFYFSNMSPMFNSFNGGYWVSFENKVRAWATSFDKLYVTKGGTLNHLLKNGKGVRNGQDGVMPATDENGFTIKGLACPQYYFIAILGVKGEKYQAIGFKVEHRDDYGYTFDKNQAPVSVVKDAALSIDELETFTGLDFFCNLPDGIEEEVEKSFSLDSWSW